MYMYMYTYTNSIWLSEVLLHNVTRYNALPLIATHCNNTATTLQNRSLIEKLIQDADTFSTELCRKKQVVGDLQLKVCMWGWGV